MRVTYNWLKEFVPALIFRQRNWLKNYIGRS